MKTGLIAIVLAAAALALPALPQTDAGPRPPIVMPADYPKDVPVPKEAKPVEAKKRPDGTYRLVLQSPASMQDAVAFYHKQLPASGWAITVEKSKGLASSLIADKGDRTAAIGVFDRGGFRQITIEADPPR